jgi:hypothetical protein
MEIFIDVYFVIEFSSDAPRIIKTFDVRKVLVKILVFNHDTTLYLFP